MFLTQRNTGHLKEENFKLKKKNREREKVKWKMMKDKFIEITKIYYKPCYEKKPRNSNKTSIHFENSFEL